ncbi:fruit-body specific protein a [Moniliophthora roreri MCA 2997]|uniref:Fruit-body specific protein a n=2 Tax=Moniliophthora roreri TaxID=221103 RepID=V2WLW7_MONRO|nr:fruit-body specific protein a [Moniliophthora roreri MCA 2997]KAI3616485.1 fruit-body specific protein a [Moniliophthora roreri]
MRFFVAIALALAFANGAFATLGLQSYLGGILTKNNHYGAPIPPWKEGCYPGWYYGNNHGKTGGYIPWLKDGLVCKLLDLLPFCIKCPKPQPPPPSYPPPPPHDGYTEVFSGYDGAIQADDYLTFGLVDTVADCKAMCDDVEGCTFFNTYYDINGKDDSPLLTCALFKYCHTKEDAINKGGQNQIGDGRLNYIKDSAGYCKA